MSEEDATRVPRLLLVLLDTVGVRRDTDSGADGGPPRLLSPDVDCHHQ